MRKVLGILTEDFRLYHDLVAALKARDLPFTSLSFARRIPDAVGAVLTSPAEASRVRLRHVVPVDDIDSSIAKALQLLRGKSEWEELRIGVDPGRETGVAIIGDGEVIDTRIAASDIAKSSGRRVEPPVEIRPTPGEVREIQRRSRLDSGGVVTISSELAGAVARGDLTLEEAITQAKRKERQSQG